MLVSATTRGTLPGRDGTPGQRVRRRPPSSRVSVPDSIRSAADHATGVPRHTGAGPRGTALGATFLFGDSLDLTDQVRGQRQRQDSSGAHGLAPVSLTSSYLPASRGAD